MARWAAGRQLGGAADLTRRGHLIPRRAYGACDTGATTDQIEEYAAGGSGLQNLGDGYYKFNWKTPKAYAKSSKTVALNLGDGRSHAATFTFTK